MDQISTGLLRLNLETRTFHYAADAGWLGLLRPSMTRSDYIAWLVTTYGFEAPLEAALAYTPKLKPCIDLRQRSRAGLIAKDLLALGMRAQEISTLPQCLIAPFSGPVEAFGWLYALERATLVHDRVRSHVLARLPNARDACAYLSAYDGVVNARWNELGHAIDRAVRTEHGSNELVTAAQRAFRQMSEWSEHHGAFARGA